MSLSLAAPAVRSQGFAHDGDDRDIRHVLLISIDGMRALDYVNCAKGGSTINSGTSYCPNLAALGNHGINYLDATTSKPSDSFPGLMAIVSGGSPRTVGAFYDVAYDRSLDPPAKTTGNGVAAGNCVSGATPTGTTTEYEEGIDIDQSLLNGGAPSGGGGINSIDPARLPRDPAKGCAPVFPSNVDDYYSPEVNSLVVSLPGVSTPGGMSCAPVADPSQTGSWTDSFQNIQCYDTLKVQAILHEIDGQTHDGKSSAKVPNLLGMNFQAVSVGQKLIEKNVATGGHLDAIGTPSPKLLGEIEFVDASIGEMVSSLKKHGLLEKTLIVITAKHGQTPIDPKRFFPIPGPTGNNGQTPANILASLLPFSESPSNPTGIGPTQDDSSLLWLADAAQTANAVSLLQSNAVAAGIGQIIYGPALGLLYNLPGLAPGEDPRTPDIVVVPNFAVVDTGSSKKLEEHGGFGHDDTNVMLLLSHPDFSAKTVSGPVETTQVAPTILKVLGLDPHKLDAVRLEGTQVLPGVSSAAEEDEQ